MTLKPYSQGAAGLNHTLLWARTAVRAGVFFWLNIDGDAEIAVGIEAFHDGDGEEMIILCTVLPPKEKP